MEEKKNVFILTVIDSEGVEEIMIEGNVEEMGEFVLAMVETRDFDSVEARQVSA